MSNRIITPKGYPGPNGEPEKQQNINERLEECRRLHSQHNADKATLKIIDTLEFMAGGLFHLSQQNTHLHNEHKALHQELQEAKKAIAALVKATNGEEPGV